MDIPWRRVAATPRPRRGYSAETSRAPQVEGQGGSGHECGGVSFDDVTIVDDVKRSPVKVLGNVSEDSVTGTITVRNPAIDPSACTAASSALPGVEIVCDS